MATERPTPCWLSTDAYSMHLLLPYVSAVCTTAHQIKISKPFIISPIINICNKMLAQVIYPERLKFSLIRPIYKSGDKSSPSNYRPISLLLAFSKIF